MNNDHISTGLPRRFFLNGMVASGLLAATNPLRALAAHHGKKSKVKLGYDNFAVRAMNWMVEDHLKYAEKLNIDSLFMSDLDHFKSLDMSYLRDVRKKADDLGIDIHVGTWSICPTSTTFKDKWGTAEEHLRLSIRVAEALGSPVIRVILGNRDDRRIDEQPRNLASLRLTSCGTAELPQFVIIQNHSSMIVFKLLHRATPFDILCIPKNQILTRY